LGGDEETGTAIRTGIETAVNPLDLYALGSSPPSLLGAPDPDFRVDLEASPSLLKMNKILESDLDYLLALVEAGVVTNDLLVTVQECGLFFAAYPMCLQTCFIGGNIAENAGSSEAVKYAVTGRYVQGFQLVTPAGDVVWLGGRLAKDVTGYDLKSLVIGSEKTLGMATKAIIKLIGYPSAKSDLFVLFKTPKEAIEVVAVIPSKGLAPTSIELMDQLSITTSCR
jgi:glycolate oxidase